ncbi:MAG: VWA domain-containing protein [Ruminococcaceae bacterium]|nr:VWA domain-containing protein [Oscillospiraceae bacterium]
MKKFKRLTSLFLAMLMVIMMIPVIPVSADSPSIISHEEGLIMNDNQGDGVVLTKLARPHLVNGVPDGTVDIVINALTTGTVTNTESVIPTDIVLVLDVSGSMNDADSHSIDTYNAVNGSAYESGYGYRADTYYGFSSSSTTYYIKLSDGSYQSVSRSNADDNNYYYYRYGSWNSGYTYVYPALDASVTNPDRTENYDVVQFYTRTTTTTTTEKKITELKNAVSDFIDAALASNASITNEADKHRISIVKFADDSYYNGSGSTQDVTAAVNGNNTFRQNNQNYNYTQIVTGLTTVNDSGAATLKSAVNSLQPGGATAIDYGLTLAEHALFDDRTAADIAGRHEIVVLFTDGSPTHSSSYDPGVAADAVNVAYALKSANVELYSISVAANADDDALGTDQTNQFCHYVSSNYPSAQASGNTITPGTGSPSNGYYWVPDNVLSLSAIFETVMSQIGTPTMELGASATTIDTVSPYFTLPNGVNNVTLATAAKTVDGWAAEVVDNSLGKSVVGNTLEVTGFDFDANYVSTTPREGGFYGKMLVIRINVTPDYDTIDARTDAIASNGGYINTNLGTASMVDSAQNAVAVVNSPEIKLNTVTYMLDGQVYATYYRLPGTDVTVLPKHADSESHTYSDWTTADVTVDGNREFTMPSGNVVLSATSTARDFTVSYEYRGDIPSGVSVPPVPSPVIKKAGTTVKVEDKPEVPGYVFHGWQAAEVTPDPTSGEFTMPARNVTFIGSFAPSNTVTYKVEHYLQNIDGTYPTEPTNYHYHHDGTTGHTVTAITTIEYPHYTYDPSISTPSGIVLSDGSLILKLYYALNPHKVTYVYDHDDENPAPDGALALLPAEVKNVLSGSTFTIAAAPKLQGYTFIGWASDGSDVIITDGKFLMPDRDVILHGFFLPDGDTPYTVEHHLETDVENVFAFYESTKHTGETGATVVGEPLSYKGYTYNKSISYHTDKIKADGTLTLVLKYEKTPYTVSYRFEGNEPHTGWPTIPADYSSVQHMGEDVTVRDVINVDGYTFIGWTAGNVTVGNDGKFTMPDEDVVFVGFYARNEAHYTISHYFQHADGTWGDPQISYTVDSHEGESVSASYVSVDGYETFADHPDTKTSGIVLIDDSLTLKFFYVRKSFTVKYEYEGFVPSNADPLPSAKTYLHGAEVDVADNATAAGYTFSGWSSKQVTVTSGGKFIMPESDVIITGHFNANTGTPYKVEHYLQSLSDPSKYDIVAEDTKTYTGTTGYSVTATLNSYEGFTARTDNILTGIITPEPDILVIKLYYDRNSYNIDYRYFGIQPSGTPNIDIDTYDQTGVPYGTTVFFGAKPTLENYAFSGWYWLAPHVAVTSDSFTMPAMDVIILGEFTENAKYTVSYEYEGTIPSGAPELPGATYHHPKQNVTVAQNPTLAGYTFSGWTSEQVKSEDIVGGKFDMPEKNVVFKGSFERNATTGYICIEKELIAPAGFKAIKDFTFKVYRVNGKTHTLVDTVKVAGNSVKYLEVAPGDYYIVEAKADAYGYAHSVISSKDNNIVTVELSNISNIKFTNVYVEVQLEKDDHFGYIIGYPDGTVRPDNFITRAEIATIFFRMLTDSSRAKVWSQANDFTDVNVDDWYNNAISTLANAGVLNGYADSTFRPNEYITRAELVKIATSFYGTSAGKDTHFSDTSGHWANDFIEAARELGFIDGYGDGTFRPNQLVTRAEAMKIINRTLDRVPHKDHLHKDMIVWSDNMNKKKWYYAEVQEATNSHVYVWDNVHEIWIRITDVRDWAALEKAWSSANSR